MYTMRFIIIILIFTCSFNLLAQKMIVFIDYDKIYNNHPIKSYYDSITINSEKRAIEQFEFLVSELNYRKNYFARCVDYPKEAMDSINQIADRKIKEIYELQMQIQEFQESAKTELKELKNKHDSIIRNDILAVIDSISLERKYFYVVDKKDLVYYLSNQDVTGIVLSRIIEK